MAPIEEAKQPIVIGDVVIGHTDQKVCLVLESLWCFGFHSSSWFIQFFFRHQPFLRWDLF
jgi:hypothetical protein